MMFSSAATPWLASATRPVVATIEVSATSSGTMAAVKRAEHEHQHEDRERDRDQADLGQTALDHGVELLLGRDAD